VRRAQDDVIPPLKLRNLHRITATFDEMSEMSSWTWMVILEGHSARKGRMNGMLSFTALHICLWISGSESVEFASRWIRATTSSQLSDMIVYHQ
jgi:hypothetical protein